ncbi:1-acyl-sn-glycerol-3-phosphate acyltransferase [Mangrovibacterium lignilyticum]|uniref:1-acyl-sn-glycerol-3-phosphate acyltransferase n=1 Tax=Mangrovibacterium lignilyticum TaxID=2668052 RepID=UPI0013D76314|nr:1-acyl-sn-glycerol-3-phosphate acyltransferase [Mangrovibacterium lignilyticum]
MQAVCRFLLNLLGWKAVNGVMPHKKAIIIGVPHTSAWDFVISYLYYTSVGGVAHVVIKKEFFFWPVGYFLRKAGAIPIDRSKGTTVVKQIIAEMNSREFMHLAITPEGTRELTTRWKAGFHTIAKATGAIVYLGFFDFGKKEVGWLETLDLSNDPQQDIRRMKTYYHTRGLVGKHPEKFTLDD